MTTIPTDLHGDTWDDVAAHRGLRRVLGIVGALAATLAIAASPWALDAPWLRFAFKPLATLCIIAWTVLRPADGSETGARVKRWIVVGLVASLAGDVALLWPQGFLVGLVSFLVGHVAYLVAFTRPVRFFGAPLAFAAYAVVAGLILMRLWPGVPADLHLPVAVYVTALAAMAAQAASVAWRRRGQPDARRWMIAAVGGALFVASDAILAVDKFGGGLALVSLLNLVPYWAGQWCLASAAGNGRR